MATEKLFKVKIIALQNEKEKIVEFLQEKGVMHINPVEEIEDNQELLRDIPLGKIQDISHALLEMRWMEEQLRNFAMKKSPKSYTNEEVDITLEEYEKLKKEVHGVLADSVNIINKSRERKKELLNKIELFSNMPFEIGKQGYPVEGNLTFSWLLEIPIEDKEYVDIGELLKDYTDKITLIIEDGFALVQGMNKDKEDVSRIIKQNGIRILKVEGIAKEKKDEISAMKDELKQVNKVLNEKRGILKELARDNYKQIVQLQHILGIFHDRYEITTSFLRTKKTFILEGFIPHTELGKLEKLGKISKAYIIKEEVEEAPSKLRHLPYVGRFAFITKLFGLPKYGKLDPTIYISFFLPLFFGFMFSDIGYGLMILAMAIFMLSRATKEMIILKDAGIVLFVCAISTILFGWLFGSFFGGLIFREPLWINPFDEALMVLILGLSFGLLHLNLGLILNSYENLKAKDFKGFLLNNISVFSLEAGAVFLALGQKWVGGGLVALAVFLLIMKSSLMGIMEVTGFAGTWFSYARLLALSLATGGIALSINIIAEQLGAVKFVGPVLFGVVIIFGHLFNFVLNILGSSINSVRLHYIEFFSQFYEGGGKPFKAFDTKRVKDSI